MREQLEISEDAWGFDMDVEHHLALNIELHEFFNACHKSWKYWKRKDMNMTDVLDEAVDVIHFCMLLLNKSPLGSVKISEYLKGELQALDPLEDRTDVKNTMFFMIGRSVTKKLCGVMQILDYYGFTTLDILSAYNKKNKVNFERLNNGY